MEGWASWSDLGAGAFGAGVLVDAAGVAVDLGRGEDGEGGVGGGAVEAGGFEDGFEFAGAYDGVDFGDVGADLVAVTLDQAAGYDEALGAAAVGDLVLDHLEDGVDGFLLGGVDEGAGVDDEDVGVFGAGGELGAAAMEQAHHDLGVDEVLGAAERDEAYRGGFVRLGSGDWVSGAAPSSRVEDRLTVLYFSRVGGLRGRRELSLVVGCGRRCRQRQGL